MQPAPEQRTPAPRSWWILIAAFIGLTLIATLALWQLRQDTLGGQARELRLLSLALTGEIDRGLQGAEEGLRAMQDELREGRVPTSGTDAGRALKTRADLMPLVRTLWLVDRDGHVLSASDKTPAPELKSFLPVLETLGEDATSVSRPFIDVDAHESLVALATRFTGSPGTPGGWILAAIPASELLGAFSTASPAADARMAIYRSDGVVLAGEIVAAPTLGEASVAQRMAGMQSMEVRRFRDDSEHLVAVHTLSHYGVKVVFTRDLSAVLATWGEAVRLTAAALVLMLAIAAASMYAVRRAHRHRAEAQRALQAQLSRSSKLESLGTLAGGVAHDFNNVLAAIVGFCEMAQDTASHGSDQARYLDKLLQAALRGKSLVQRILTFSRGGARTSIVFEFEPIVEEALSLLSASLRPGIVLERRLEAHGAKLRGDPTQVFEAVMNLCTNAMQAMPEGGMLSIELVRRHVDGVRVLSHSQVETGGYLALTVADQGSGITPEVMEHLFEPFFTTRGAGGGTGLGLAVVHGVVAELGGAIDVQSLPVAGARFTLYFPECTDPIDSASQSPLAAPGGAGQTLLVVDDEPVLVGLAEEMLKGLGYEPIGFSDPVAALEASRKDPQRFAAVITDEVMPGLSGTRLTEALREHAPQLPVLLVSGYGGTLLAARAADAGVNRVLAKPLQRAQLAHALSEVLR